MTRERAQRAMDGVRRLHYTLIGAAMLLYGTVAYGQLHETVQGVEKVADIAKDKGVVWLALVTAIIALGVGVFKDVLFARAFTGLKDELAKRPCVYRAKD